MQTFLPLPDFTESARCLDRLRLGKQRVEVLQLVRALDGASGWSSHPAARMWRQHRGALIRYGLSVCLEWMERGYVDNCAPELRLLRRDDDAPHDNPPWFGSPEFHASHRSNLLRKDRAHYGKFGWTESPDLPYVWPVSP